MNTLADQLATLNLDFTDTDTVIDDDDERNDAMGDLPNWDTIELTEFKLDFCYYDRKRGFIPLESLLGDGSWDGRPNWKGDAPTDSLTQLAHRELTMLKFLTSDEVNNLRRHISNILAANSDESPASSLEGDDYVSSTIQVIYEQARTRRWTETKRYQGATARLINRLNLNPRETIKDLFLRTIAFTNEVRKRANNTSNPSTYRKEMRDDYINKIRSTLKLNKVYGTPWKFFNSLYWNTLFEWHTTEVPQILNDCAVRYAYAVNYDDMVNGD